MSAGWIALLVFGILVLVVLLLAIFSTLLKNAQRKHSEEVLNLLGRENIVSIASNANLFGQKSKGLSQIRGNGIWVLTKNRIFFRLMAPKRTIEIPYSTINKTEIVRSFMKKMVAGAKVLVVYYIDETGNEDACGWYVPDWEKRRAMIDELVIKAQQ